MNVLLVEDERSIRVTLRDDLNRQGHTVTALGDGGLAIERLKQERFDCLITDVRLPVADGMEVLKAAKAMDPGIEVILITGYGTIEQTVEAMRAGAFDYIQKPFPNEIVAERLERLQQVKGMNEEISRLRAELENPERPYGLVGRSPQMTRVLDTITTVAPSDATVLIQGESGTGKEVVARALHRLSERVEGPFVGVACAALPDTLIEDELFGHEKGAFTDARKYRKGRFEMADGGTIFLDEVDDLPLPIQVKLLRVIQERSFERIGGEKQVSVDVRIIAATKVDLEARVREGRFRDDLFYRLNVVPLTLPPLREREGDIPLLARHFLAKYSRDRELVIPAELLEAMEKCSWPGNVRQLENHLARAVAFAGKEKTLKREHLIPADAQGLPEYSREEKGEENTLQPLAQVLKQAEQEHLERVLEHTGGHRSKSAEILGISRKTLWEKMKEAGLK